MSARPVLRILECKALRPLDVMTHPQELSARYQALGQERIDILFALYLRAVLYICLGRRPAARPGRSSAASTPTP
jgi:hypothetical protein